MRLLDEVVDIVPGERARCLRHTVPEDWFFQGHFPGEPIVPAVVLLEMLAQAGGLAAGSAAAAQGMRLQLRVAAFAASKFPDAARPGDVLAIDARVVARLGRLFKIEGEVTVDGRLVATGGVTLADAASPVP